MGLIFQSGYNIVAAILRGIGDSKETLYFLLVASVINVVLDIIFVYNLNMGAAIAADIAQTISCIVGFVFIQRAVNSYGEAMTGSFTVAQKVETYMTLPASALMTTQGTYTGQNIGANRIDRVKTGAKHTVVISEIISVCILTAHDLVEQALALCRGESYGCTILIR